MYNIQDDKSSTTLYFTMSMYLNKHDVNNYKILHNFNFTQLFTYLHINLKMFTNLLNLVNRQNASNWK